LVQPAQFTKWETESHRKKGTGLLCSHHKRKPRATKSPRRLRPAPADQSLWSHAFPVRHRGSQPGVGMFTKSVETFIQPPSLLSGKSWSRGWGANRLEQVQMERALQRVLPYPPPSPPIQSRGFCFLRAEQMTSHQVRGGQLPRRRLNLKRSKDTEASIRACDLVRGEKTENPKVKHPLPNSIQTSNKRWQRPAPGRCGTSKAGAQGAVPGPSLWGGRTRGRRGTF